METGNKYSASENARFTHVTGSDVTLCPNVTLFKLQYRRNHRFKRCRVWLINNHLKRARKVLLSYWFARKNRDDTVIFVAIFIAGTNQVRSIADKIVPLQSRSVFYERAKADSARNIKPLPCCWLSVTTIKWLG